MASALEQLEKRVFPNGKNAWIAIARDDCNELEHLIETGEAGPNEMFPFDLSGFIRIMLSGPNDNYCDLYLRSLKNRLAEGNVVNMVHALISLDAEPDTDNSTSILMMACIFGQVDIVRMLIKKGADLHYRTENHNVSALHFAVAAPSAIRNMGVIFLLIDPPTNDFGLGSSDTWAEYGDALDIAKYLLQRDVFINLANKIAALPILAPSFNFAI